MRIKNGEIKKAMVLGSATREKDGTFRLTAVGRARAERVAELYESELFNRRDAAILIAGGYGKCYADRPPSREQREGKLLANYLMKRYAIPGSALLIEDESTNTIENWQYSMGQHEEFFDEVISGNERLGLVSHPNHLKRVQYIGEQLGLRADMLLQFPTYAQDNAKNEAAAFERTRRYFEDRVFVRSNNYRAS